MQLAEIDRGDRLSTRLLVHCGSFCPSAERRSKRDQFGVEGRRVFVETPGLNTLDKFRTGNLADVSDMETVVTHEKITTGAVTRSFRTWVRNRTP